MQGAMEQWTDKLIAGGITAVIGSIGWLVRTVLTNNKKIELLQLEIKARDARREEDRKDVSEIKSDMKELRRDFTDFLRRHYRKKKEK